MLNYLEEHFVMGLHFLRGNGQTPRGHALFFARSTNDSQVIYSTYCLIPPIPMSLAKYFPPIFAAQIPIEELQGAVRISGMPIPPMLEEGLTLEQLEELAERRDDDLCDLGTTSSEEVERMQAASANCQEYAQLYASYIAQKRPPAQKKIIHSEPLPVDELDPEELLLEAMPERQKLTELGKLIGTARYALDGQDIPLLRETKRRMERTIRRLPEKYRGIELVAAATSNKPNSGRLAELYLSRAYKLADEEYADIPGIDRTIQDLQTKE
jgi:hypothetical protein